MNPDVGIALGIGTVTAIVGRHLQWPLPLRGCVAIVWTYTWLALLDRIRELLW